MHTPTTASGLAPFELLSRRAALGVEGLDLRLSPAELETLSLATIRGVRRALDDVASSPDLFRHTSTVPWACCSVPADALPAAMERLRSSAQLLEYVHETLVELQVLAETRERFHERADALREVARALTVMRPSVLDVQPQLLGACRS
jgi:hypothetical protein